MTALVMSTKSFLQDFVVGWAMATGKIKDSYKKVTKTAYYENEYSHFV